MVGIPNLRIHPNTTNGCESTNVLKTQSTKSRTQIEHRAQIPNLRMYANTTNGYESTNG
jgi:hypothetical protein